jgi:hypothetical protein
VTWHSFLNRAGRVRDALTLAVRHDQSLISGQTSRTLEHACLRWLQEAEVLDDKAMETVLRFATRLNADNSPQFLEDVYYALNSANQSLLLSNIAQSAADIGIQRLTASVFQALLCYLDAQNNPVLLASVLLWMDLSSVDVHLALGLCRRYNLRDAAAFIVATVLSDPITPIREAIDALKVFMSICTEKNTVLKLWQLLNVRPPFSFLFHLSL